MNLIKCRYLKSFEFVLDLLLQQMGHCPARTFIHKNRTSIAVVIINFNNEHIHILKPQKNNGKRPHEFPEVIPQTRPTKISQFHTTVAVLKTPTYEGRQPLQLPDTLDPHRPGNGKLSRPCTEPERTRTRRLSTGQS